MSTPARKKKAPIQDSGYGSSAFGELPMTEVHPKEEKNISLVFFGSGPVAANSLELLAKDFSIEAVITKPKPAHHRGDFPVLSVCDELNIKTLTPSNKKELSDLFTTRPVKSSLGIVIDYGIIISQDVIDYFPLGIINSHFSLLPQWRGADPISFAILSGQKKTGISLMQITAGLDEGPLLAQSSLSIPDDLTAPKLTEQLIKLSHSALQEVLPLYVEGKVHPEPQETSAMIDKKTPTYSRKLTKEDSIIDWDKPAEQLEREVRAFLDWPKSKTTLANKEVIITSAKVAPQQGKPGDVKATNKELLVFCGKDALSVLKLKPSGKNEMTASAFLAGYGRMLQKK